MALVEKPKTKTSLRQYFEQRVILNKKGKHTSVDKELKQSLCWLEKQDCVRKVVLGLCESARHAYKPGTLRHQMDVAGGIKIKAYGGKGVIDIFVKVDIKDKEDLLKKIKLRWQI